MATERVLGGRYRLGAVIGRGGMAEVHRGRDVRLGRDVAIKLLRSDLARDPSFHGRFRREAQSAASLNHPAIVAVYDTGEDNAGPSHVPFIVMEYVDGRTMEGWFSEAADWASRRKRAWNVWSLARSSRRVFTATMRSRRRSRAR